MLSPSLSLPCKDATVKAITVPSLLCTEAGCPNRKVPAKFQWTEQEFPGWRLNTGDRTQISLCLQVILPDQSSDQLSACLAGLDTVPLTHTHTHPPHPATHGKLIQLRCGAFSKSHKPHFQQCSLRRGQPACYLLEGYLLTYSVQIYSAWLANEMPLKKRMPYHCGR